MREALVEPLEDLVQALVLMFRQDASMLDQFCPSKESVAIPRCLAALWDDEA
jgi:hypothetical protein